MTIDLLPGAPDRRTGSRSRRSTPPPKHGRAWRASRLTLMNGAPVLLIIGWWVASRYQPAYIVPDPLAVLHRTWDLLAGDRALFANTYISFTRVGISVLIAVALGTAIALTAKYVTVLEGLLVDRLMVFVNAFPSIGWAIAGMYWFGVSTPAVIFVEVAIILPFTLITIWEGLKALDAELMEMAQSFTRDTGRIIVKVVAPFLAPYLFSALRISYAGAWKVAIIAEIFGASEGLGYLLNTAREQFDSTTLYACILTLILIVYVVDKGIFRPVETKLLRYRKAASSHR
jgi:NitT/TauT family transport system permease protein